MNIKIAIRNARKNRVLSFAKLFSISLSFAVILFAAGYVYFETSFDKFIPDKERIFRCFMTGNLNGDQVDYAVTSAAMAQTVKQDVPEIEETMRVRPGGESSMVYQDQLIQSGQLVFADPNFFSFFSLPLKMANSGLFGSPNDIAISESLATKVFGNADAALGKIVKMNGDDCVITGVFNDFPANFHLQYDLVQSLEKTEPDQQNLESQSYFTYIKTVGSNVNPDELGFLMSKSIYTHSLPQVDGAKAKNWDDLKAGDSLYLFYMAEPLTEIHFSNHKFEMADTASKTYVYGAVILAILVLLISSVNFTNLTVANLSTRLKEIGVRKSSGAFNLQIAGQFLFESCLFLLAGFVMAVAIYKLADTPLSNYLGLRINIPDEMLARLFLFTFLGLLLFSVSTNILPVYYVSKRRMLSLLKDEHTSRRRFPVKNGLVFLQFVLSALIILASVFVQRQINYMVSKNRGYDSNNILMFNLGDLEPERRASFLDELKAYPAVKDIATSDVQFGKNDPSMNSAFFEVQTEENYFHPSYMKVSDEFLNTFELTMDDGRFFKKEFKTDDDAAILNETAAKAYLGEGTLIGKQVFLGGHAYNVIGIMKDFNFRSLYHKIEPLIILRSEDNSNVFVKVQNSEAANALRLINRQWTNYQISQPFRYKFHDEVIAEQYGGDQQAKKLLLIFSIISIAIACVGLYAISLFMIIGKTKEIGIRKVNGARISEVMLFLNKDFIKWVVVAFFVASPAAWYIMNLWLETFAFRVALSWWVFVSAGLAILVIALLTVSYQSYKAANRNPVEALRYE